MYVCFILTVFRLVEYGTRNLANFVFIVVFLAKGVDCNILYFRITSYLAAIENVESPFWNKLGTYVKYASLGHSARPTRSDPLTISLLKIVRSKKSRIEELLYK